MSCANDLISRWAFLNQEIRQTKRPYQRQEWVDQHIHEIAPGIFLGNHKAFMEVLDGCPIGLVVSACPLEHMDSIDKPEEEIRSTLSNRNITWVHVGEDVGDDSKDWFKLVAACTNTRLDQIDLIPPTQWFEPLFQNIDKALENQASILIHCQMGVSRSAAVLSAYLINRCHVTALQALAFLQARRPCVLTNFFDHLEQYEKYLQPAAAPTPPSPEIHKESLQPDPTPTSPLLNNALFRLKQLLQESPMDWKQLKDQALSFAKAMKSQDLDQPAIQAFLKPLVGTPLHAFCEKWIEPDIWEEGLDSDIPPFYISRPVYNELIADINNWLANESSIRNRPLSKASGPSAEE